MKDFKADSINVKQMSNIKGGGVDITMDDVKVNITKYKGIKSLATEQDTRVEVSGTVTIEK